MDPLCSFARQTELDILEITALSNDDAIRFLQLLKLAFKYQQQSQSVSSLIKVLYPREKSSLLGPPMIPAYMWWVMVHEPGRQGNVNRRSMRQTEIHVYILYVLLLCNVYAMCMW